MNAVPLLQVMGKLLAVSLLFSVMITGVCAYGDTPATTVDPVVYLNFNEGSGSTAFDLSGHGASGTLYGVDRMDNDGCGRAVFFNGGGEYISIPYRSANHPEKEITVSTWFYTDSFDPQVLVSSHYDGGGYRLGFGDGDDLWWTVNLQGSGEVSVPIQHDSITPHEWHYVSGTYNGESSKIYLDGILRNQANATGPIHYEYNNYVQLGAEAGTYDKPAPVCPHFFRGGLDEVRIYPVALTTSEIIDNRLRCTPATSVPGQGNPLRTRVASACMYDSGSISLGSGETAFRTLTFNGANETGVWNVVLPPGSTLEVGVKDLYSASYPDAWYVELGDEKGRIDRTVVFAKTTGDQTEGVVPSGNATVKVKYFNGKNRFPATVDVRFTGIAPPPPPSAPPLSPQTLLSNPIIVIYSASWATLIAILLVVIWLHRRNKEQK